MFHDNTRPHMPLQRKISSRHLVGNNSVIPPYDPELAPSGFHMFLHLKTFLGGRRFHDDNKVKEAVNTGLHHRQHYSTMQGYKNWCPTMKSASTMVEARSKCRVWYVHQMAL
jgi:hypothetical protein